MDAAFMLSTETHRGEERHDRQTLHSVHLQEPIPVLLEYTIAHFAMLGENSIQARFGGGSLMPTVKKANESITDLSDLVPMQEHFGETIFVLNASISKTPIVAALDSSIHESLDLTHGWGCLVN